MKRTIILSLLTLLTLGVPLTSHAGGKPYCEQLEKPMQVKTNISFGYNNHGYPFDTLTHNAIDLAMEKNTPIYASADGVVVHVNKPKRKHQKRPARIIIEHDNGFSTRYAQLRRVKVKKGQQVKQGDMIANSGGGPNQRGSFRSTGPHLHFAVRQNNVPLDPTCIVE